MSIAQEITFISFNIVLNEPDTLRIGKLDINDCTYSTQGRGVGDNLRWMTDVTLNSDSVYYRFIPIGFDSQGDNSLWQQNFEPFFTGTKVEQFSESKEGMTCDRQGNLYLAGEKLSRWNTDNGQVTELGDLPPSMHCRGDLTFRRFDSDSRRFLF